MSALCRSRRSHVDASHISHLVKPVHQALYEDGSPTSSSSKDSCTLASTFSSDSDGNGVSAGELLVHSSKHPTSGIDRALALQDTIITAMKNKTSQDNSTASTPRMILPVFLTSREIENKLRDHHFKNIKQKLSHRAQAARDAARKTKLLLQHFMLLRKTESTRPKKEDTGINMRYLETLDGLEYQVEMKFENEAKKQAVSLLHNEDYQFYHRSYETCSKNEVVMKYGTEFV